MILLTMATKKVTSEALMTQENGTGTAGSISFVVMMMIMIMTK